VSSSASARDRRWRHEFATDQKDRTMSSRRLNLSTEKRRARLHLPIDRPDRRETPNTIKEPISVLGRSLSAFTSDSHGNSTLIEDPFMRLTTLTYTANGGVLSITDLNNHTTTIQDHSQDRVTTPDRGRHQRSLGGEPQDRKERQPHRLEPPNGATST